GDHALSAPSRLHRARPRPRAGAGPDRAVRRQGVGGRARGKGLRRLPGCRSLMVSAMPSDSRDMVVGTEPWLAQFAALKESLPGADLPWLAELREAGCTRFAELGLPTHKVEAWKYTSLRPLARVPFAPAATEPGVSVVPKLLAEDQAAARLVFVN